jgi:ElaB/YqjD/DUF883 family membrane-anchored ribosome-binding protein
MGILSKSIFFKSGVGWSMNVNEDMDKTEKNLEGMRDDIAGKLNKLSFDSAKNSISDLTKQAQNATSEMISQAQRMNENLTKQAVPRIKQYSEFVQDCPITATVAVLLFGLVVGRWAASRR